MTAAVALRRPAMSAEALMSRVRRGGLIGAVVLALFIPQVTNPSFSFKLALGGSFAVTLLSLVVLIGLLGQISLAQVELMAVGAYTAAHLTGHHGWPLLLAFQIGSWQMRCLPIRRPRRLASGPSSFANRPRPAKAITERWRR